MKWVKNILLLAIVWLFVAGAYRCLMVSIETPVLSARESMLLSYLLCILSIAASWLVSHYYAIYSTSTNATEKIDTIAQQSTEKIMNQSAQLWEVEQFLENAVEAAADENTIQAANNTLRNRVLASAQMIRLLRSSNSTFISDWAGVTSSDVKTKMETQIKKQQELLSSSREQGQRSAEAIQRIENVTRDLPAAALPVTPANYRRAVTITQFPSPSTNTEARGHAVLQVVRPVDNVTGRINLVPEFIDAPDPVSVVLEDVPAGLNRDQFTLRAGTASPRGFNIHLTANEAELVPSGYYRITYQARAHNGLNHNGPPEEN